MTTDSELAWTPGWRLREMFERRELSPLEVADMLLARVDKHADLGAFVTVFADHYREQARAAKHPKVAMPIPHMGLTR